MKKTLILLFGLSLVFLGGCSFLPKVFTHVPEEHTTTTITTATGVVLTSNATDQFSNYVVKHEMTGGSNAENVDVYLSGKLIFSKPATTDGSFYKLVGDTIFIDYGTSPEGREIRLFDLSNKGKMIFEARYNGGNGVQIDADTMYFDYSFYPNPKGLVCSNYAEIQKMGGGGNVNYTYMQKRSYNFKTHELKNLSEITCIYSE